MYDNGQGVPQDYKTAVKWWKLAAEQGHALAQSNLGVMYDKGQGVLQDYARAHMWWNIAASSGDSENASVNRDIVARKMTPAQIAKAQDLARECVAKNYKAC
jgi:TPR repeat protein